MKTEPLVTLASITAGATALLGLLVAFGVPLTEGQQVAVLAVVAVAAPFVVALAGRGQVTPNASVVEYVNPTSGVVKAGAANELPTDTVVRSLRNNDDDNAGPGAGHVGRLAHGGRVPPKPEKDNGLGRVHLGRCRRSHPDGVMMRRRILAAAAAFVLAVGVLPAVTSSEAQAATVCKGTVSNSPLKGQGKTTCTGMPKGARCSIVGNTASFVDVQFRKF